MKFFEKFGPVYDVVFVLDSGNIQKLKRNKIKYEKYARRSQIRMANSCILYLYYKLKYCKLYFPNLVIHIYRYI